jgi:hypothetical protein
LSINYGFAFPKLRVGVCDCARDAAIVDELELRCRPHGVAACYGHEVPGDVPMRDEIGYELREFWSHGLGRADDLSRVRINAVLRASIAADDVGVREETAPRTPEPPEMDA